MNIPNNVALAEALLAAALKSTNGTENYLTHRLRNRIRQLRNAGVGRSESEIQRMVSGSNP